jgi:hypothetical protein
MSAEHPRHQIDHATSVGRLFDVLPVPRVRSVLGPDHPLSRSSELVHTLALQAISTASPTAVGAIAAAERHAWGTTLLTASIVVELALLAILALATQVRREAVLRVIAEGPENLPLDAVKQQARRLASPSHHSQLACRLERALADARRWHQITVASRPPEGVKLLNGFEREINEIIQSLHSATPTLRGVAALELFLIGGYGSALYGGDKAELQQQLWRIRYLLNPEPSSSGSRLRSIARARGTPPRCEA